MTTLPTPIPDSYWVVPGRFLAGEYPLCEGLEESKHRIAAYLDAGIDTFFDLTEYGELVPYEDFLRAEASSDRTITYQRFPISDYGYPTVEFMKTILDALDAALAAGHNVYLHCWGGVGRTGTTVGCYLVRHGSSGREALNQLAKWWRGVPKSEYHPRSPETYAQEQFILNWNE